MRVALPTNDKKICMHFGHCSEFAIVDFNEETKQVEKVEFLVPPMHEPGVLPKWLSEHDVNWIIAGGIGMRAQEIFKSHGINVAYGVTSDESVEEIVVKFFNDELEFGKNICDH